MAGFITGCVKAWSSPCAALAFVCILIKIRNKSRGKANKRNQQGCFFIKVNKNRNKALCKQVGVQLVFQVSQHIRDQELLKSFVSYFNCGQYINSIQKE